MSKRLDENLGGIPLDGLFAANIPEADVLAVTLEAGKGIIKRGSVITGDPGGDMSVLAGAATVDKALYILTDDTDTGTSAGAGLFATAYRTGHFNRNALITDGGYSLTETDEELLRKSGILLSDALSY